MEPQDIVFDERGLVPVIVQDRLSGELRMFAFANQAALRATLETREGHFWSRSRGALWKKGETSGNTLRVVEVWTDCDRDVIVYLVDPEGPTCHTGSETCFFDRRLADTTTDRASPFMIQLEQTLAARAGVGADKSYTRSLLDKGSPKIGAKLREEADELARAIESESDDRVASEAADVIYHLLVALLFRKVPFRAVLTKLAARFGVSGHAEKASRT